MRSPRIGISGEHILLLDACFGISLRLEFVHKKRPHYLVAVIFCQGSFQKGILDGLEEGSKKICPCYF